MVILSITRDSFQDDVISVEDLEKLFPCGLGLRYAYLGALETSYLNANGKYTTELVQFLFICSFFSNIICSRYCTTFTTISVI